MTNTFQTLISMCLYVALIIGIGIHYAQRANKNSEAYFLGGRSLGPWVTALSAEASDMSGWLLMGLPGVAYWCGLADAFWTAVGLALGTYLNWLLVAKRLRIYSEKANNSITIPDFFSSRFNEKGNKPILLFSSIFILIFFSVYASSCFVACGKLFSALFNADYKLMMLLGTLLVILYTFLGGFLAESSSDLIQAFVMIFALSIITIIGFTQIENFQSLKQYDGFLSIFSIAKPSLDEAGNQIVSGTMPLFGTAGKYSFLTIISTMSWGLGYFGVPQVLLRFFAIRKKEELVKSRRIGTTWCVISLFTAIFIGMLGRILFPSTFSSPAEAENIFILMARTLTHPLVAGIVLAGILAATMSSSDSYLLIAASAFSKNLFQGFLHQKATEKQIMTVSRIALIIVALIGAVIALDENSVIFSLVSFAWAGFGAVFGPSMLFSLFHKKTTKQGILAGMISGGAMVFIWKLLLKQLGGIFSIYELLPAFIFSSIVIFVVSKLTPMPEKDILDTFDQVKALAK